MMKKLKPVIILIVMMMVSGVQASGTAGGKNLEILFTSSINGNLDGCECHAVPRAGMVSSAVYLRDRDRENTVLVDLGDFMDVYPDRLLAENILEVFGELNYDLLNPGDQEFTEGIEYLLEKRADYPMLSNNMIINGENFSDAPVIIEKLGIKLGFASIIDPRVFFFHPAEVKDAIELEDVNHASKRLFSDLSEADVRVLMYHGPSENAEMIFNDDEWDVVLFAHDQQLYEDRDGRKRFIASPGDNGNRVGIITLVFDEHGLNRIDGDFIYFDYMKDPRDRLVKRRIDLYQKEMIERLQGD